MVLVRNHQGVFSDIESLDAVHVSHSALEPHYSVSDHAADLFLVDFEHVAVLHVELFQVSIVLCVYIIAVFFEKENDSPSQGCLQD